MKRITGIAVGAALMAALLAGCGTTGAAPTPSPSAAPTAAPTASAPAATEGEIVVTSREEGSGTRGAFIELFGIEQKDADGKKVDHTVDTAEITNSTQVMMTSVAQNPTAIGYISLGSLNDTVKALAIDGAAATVEHVKSGSYKISRPFNIATKGGVSDVTADFIAYILSAEGQAVVEKAGYISSGNTGAYSGSKPSGKIVVAGSSSVSPLMEKLKEAYLAVNTSATIDIQQSDSTTGMTSAMDGVCDIGMASRALKDSELAELTPTVIATDGIAVIVSPENTFDGLSAEQVKDIYTGAVTDWSELG
ncbi:Phosphate-binding protein PstS 2 [bioreactor metagenome]|uniref:Phosphate-binding protein PstS 2 n=1 Tax=bioreactor metagenome TaxID=1076179 RepID=A0A644YU81_9ZZZZ